MALQINAIDCLLYADDLLLMSETECGLQNCVSRLQDYCNTWELNVNTSKTKVLVFNDVMAAPQIILNGAPLEVVQSYKYLGLKLSSCGSFRQAKEDLKGRALKAQFKAIKCFTGVCLQ